LDPLSYFLQIDKHSFIWSERERERKESGFVTAVRVGYGGDTVCYGGSSHLLPCLTSNSSLQLQQLHNHPRFFNLQFPSSMVSMIIGPC